MSLLGKILAVLNIFGMVGFVLLAMMVYAKRQSWAHAVFRQDVALNGLPLVADEADIQGFPIAEKFSESDRKELFPTGDAPTSQEGEVRRLQTAVQGKVNSLQSDPREQAKLCTQTLEPFVLTGTEQLDLHDCRKYLGDPKAEAELKEQMGRAFQQAQATFRKPPADQQKRTFREAFDEALYLKEGWNGGPFTEALLAALPPTDPAKWPANTFEDCFKKSIDQQREKLSRQTFALFEDALETRNRSPEQRKRRIARLLFGLVVASPEAATAPVGAAEDLTADPAFRRFATIVGVRAAVEAIRDEAMTLSRVADELRAVWKNEQSVFAVRHDRILDQVRDRARQLDTETAQLKHLSELVAAHEEELKKQRLTVKTYTEELEQAREQTAKEVQELRDLSAVLHRERVKLRDAMDNNQKLEKQLRTLEQSR